MKKVRIVNTLYGNYLISINGKLYFPSESSVKRMLRHCQKMHLIREYYYGKNQIIAKEYEEK